jgi:hypothetical protein
MSFARVYLQGWVAGGDETLWRAARQVAMACGLGDIGATPKDAPRLDLHTMVDEPSAIYMLLELHHLTGRKECLLAAQRVADNILTGQVVRNLFVSDRRSLYAQLNPRQPLALLHLAAAMRGRNEQIADDLDGRRAFLAAKTRPTDPMYIHDFRRLYSQLRPE